MSVRLIHKDPGILGGSWVVVSEVRSRKGIVNTLLGIPGYRSLLPTKH